MFQNIKLLKYSKYSTFTKSQKNGECTVCGYKGEFEFHTVIDDNLTKAWKLTDAQRKDFDNRESSKCRNCGASLRIRNLARALLQVENSNHHSIKSLAKDKEFKKKTVSEINNCGALHEFLTIPKLYYSEFDPDAKSKNIKHEDLQNLSYKDNFFDYVLTTDTLEHIPITQLALSEIYRVLKPGGYHIFTVPMLPSRDKTKKRAEIKNNSLTYLSTRSFHGQNTDDYLVFYEFGADLPQLIKEQGFSVSLYYCNMVYDEHSFVFVTRKEL